jgi:hypothetical protein
MNRTAIKFPIPLGGEPDRIKNGHTFFNLFHSSDPGYRSGEIKMRHNVKNMKCTGLKAVSYPCT